jgi:hypothetical protein
VNAYKAWKKNGRNQFKQGRVKKKSITLSEQVFDLIVVFVEQDMYGWGSACDGYGELGTFNASAPMAFCQATAAKEHCTYSIFFISTWQQQLKIVCFKICRTYHYSFFCE